MQKKLLSQFHSSDLYVLPLSIKIDHIIDQWSTERENKIISDLGLQTDVPNSANFFITSLFTSGAPYLQMQASLMKVSVA